MDIINKDDEQNNVNENEMLYSPQSLWNKIIEALIKELPAISLDMWIRPLIPLKIDNGKLYVKAPSENGKRIINEKFIKIINNILLRFNLVITETIVIIDGDDTTNVTKTDLINSEFSEPNPLNVEALFKKEYTFDEFVVGKCNQFAYLTAKAVAEYPGERHNPLFIYGGVGMGKTHLLHAIGNQMQLDYPSKKIIYISFEKFMNELLFSIGGNRAQSRDFRERYRKVDVLMVDDIQFIAGKERTQEEFFHTFEDLYNENKQIIIASDRPPKDINPLEERLRSRFNWDMTVDIQPPDLETRTAILHRRAQTRCLNINTAVLEFISEKITTNIRELIGFFKKVVSYSLLMNKQPSIELVRELLRDYVNESSEMLTMDTIIDVVCSYYKIDKAEIKQRRRNKEIVEPRMLCIYLICNLLPSIPQVKVGQEFKLDHTTIIHARNKIAEQIKNGERIKIIADDIKDILKRTTG